MTTKQAYDWKITLKKFGIVAIEVLIAGLASHFANNSWLLAIAPVLEAIRNFVKNWKK